MKRMLALRVTAIASNVAFIAYGLAAGLVPILILHGALLPLNVFRLVQMQRRVRMVRAVSRVPDGEDRFEWLLHLGKMRSFAPGAMLFSKDDASGSLFMIAEGEVSLPELGVTLGAGSVLGEIGLFLEDGRRTASAQAVGKVKAVEVTARRVLELYFDNPGLAFALVRLITRQLTENLRQVDAARTLPRGRQSPCAPERPEVGEAHAWRRARGRSAGEALGRLPASACFRASLVVFKPDCRAGGAARPGPVGWRGGGVSLSCREAAGH